MSYVLAEPAMMAAAATDVAAIGSTVNAAHMAAAPATVAVIPAAADEVSASIAHLFSGVAQEYHSLAGQAAAFNEQFVQHLNAGAGSYAAAEAVNAASVSPSMGSYVTVINSLAQQVFSGLSSSLQTVSSAVSTIAGAFLLPAYIAYETLVLAYLTLAIFIGLEQLLLKYAGIVIPIP